MQASAQGTGSRLGAKVTIGHWNGHPTYKWYASFIEGGKPRRKGFKTEKAAKEWSADRKKEALAHGVAQSLTAAERAAVLETRTWLESLGVSLREAINHAGEHFAKAQSSATVADSVATLLASMERSRLSTDHVYITGLRLNRFAETFGEQSIATITRTEIEEWLHGLKLSPVSVNNYRIALTGLFSDAIERGNATVNEASKVKSIKTRGKEAEILTPAELAHLLERADERIIAFARLKDIRVGVKLNRETRK